MVVESSSTLCHHGRDFGKREKPMGYRAGNDGRFAAVAFGKSLSWRTGKRRWTIFLHQRSSFGREKKFAAFGRGNFDMWDIQYFFASFWSHCKRFGETVETSFFALSASSRNRCAAFMTVETSLVMGWLLLALLALLRSSLFLHEQITGSAYLHRELEIERRKEGEITEEKMQEQPLFVTGTLKMERGERILSIKKFEPEEFMRLTSAFLGEEGEQTNSLSAP